MAVVESYEIAEGRGVSGAARDSLQYTRSFAIKINAADTPMDDIANHPGIKFGDPHPDDPSVFATSFDCSVSDDLLLYRLNVTYQAPALIDASSDGPGSEPDKGGSYDYAAAPADTWSGSSSVAAVPISTDKDGEAIVNTANTPIPDLQADKAYASLSLTRSYATAALAATALTMYTNKINSDAWAGTAAGTWKCQGGSWQKQTQSSGSKNLTYYSATFNFAYDADGWKLEQVMIGTRNAAGETITEKMVGGEKDEPISEPVGLDATGYPVTPPTKPAVASFDVYVSTAFTPIFGVPS